MVELGINCIFPGREGKGDRAGSSRFHLKKPSPVKYKITGSGAHFVWGSYVAGGSELEVYHKTNFECSHRHSLQLFWSFRNPHLKSNNKMPVRYHKYIFTHIHVYTYLDASAGQERHGVGCSWRSSSRFEMWITLWGSHPAVRMESENRMGRNGRKQQLNCKHWKCILLSFKLIFVISILLLNCWVSYLHIWERIVHFY